MALKLLVLILATASDLEPSAFDAQDPKVRLEAAVRHRDAHGPAFTSKSWGKAECRWFRAPAGSACTERVRLCRGESSSGMCDGSSSHAEWVYPTYPGEPEPTWRSGTGMGEGIPLLDWSGYDEGGAEMQAQMQCSRGGYGCAGVRIPEEASEEERKRIAEANRRLCDEARRAHEAERRRCEARVRRELRRESSELRCEVLTVQPCLKEAFVRCRAKRMEPEGVPLDEAFRVSWKRGKGQRAQESLKAQPVERPAGR